TRATPSRAARAASSVPWPGASVRTTSTAQPWRRNSRATASSARAPAPPPAAGLRIIWAWIRQLQDRRYGARGIGHPGPSERLVPPADLKHAIATQAAHGRRRPAERRSLAAIRADDVPRPPARGQPPRVAGPWHDGPVLIRSRQDLQGRAGDTHAVVIDVDEGFIGRQTRHAVPGAAPQRGQTAYAAPHFCGSTRAFRGRGTTVQRRGGAETTSRRKCGTASNWRLTSRTALSDASSVTRYQAPRRSRQFTSTWRRPHCIPDMVPCAPSAEVRLVGDAAAPKLTAFGVPET